MADSNVVSDSNAVDSRPPAIALRNISKRYPNGTLANDGVSFEVERGEIHAIVGENGAGKSTVMKMIYGLEQPTSGTILVDGRPVAFASPRDAIAAGIGLVPQHLQLVPSFTVAENIVLGCEPRRGPFIDRNRMLIEAQSLAIRFGLQVDLAAKVSALSVGVQQRIEILKALYRGAKTLLLDEPTALLTPQETDHLFEAITELVRSDLTVVMITHRLSEVREISDRFTVLRNGRVAGCAWSAEVNEHELSEMIVGRPLAQAEFPKVTADARACAVQVRGLSVASAGGRAILDDVSFDIAGGEILGVAGVEGNGQDMLAEVLSGEMAPTAGSAAIGGVPFTAQGVRTARALGVAAVPEDRLYNGVAAELSVDDNIVADRYYMPPFSRRGILHPDAIREHGRRLIAQFDVRTATGRVPIKALSGGNMQKVVLARAISSEPRFLIASQPTRGVDIGAAEALRQQLVALRDRGSAVLLISMDLDEIFALSDRIVVLYQGEIVAHFVAGQVDRREIGLYMMGLKRQQDARTTLPAMPDQANQGVHA
jgi:general nucleoside transport system ATP-binding protein